MIAAAGPTSRQHDVPRVGYSCMHGAFEGAAPRNFR